MTGWEQTTEFSERTAADRGRFRMYLKVSALGALALLVLPESWAAVAYLAFALFTIALIKRRIPELPASAQRPVTLVLWGIVLSVTGLTIRGVHSELIGVTPFPSPADALNLVAYGIWIGSVFIIVRRRIPNIGTDPILDAVVAGIAAALLQWSLVILPYLRTDGLASGAIAANLTYSALSLLLVVAAVLALVAGSTPSTSNRLLAAALMTGFAADTASTLVTAGMVPSQVGLILSPIALVLAAAGLLHPSIMTITSPPIDAKNNRRLTRRRVSVLALALLTPPVLMLWVAVEAGMGGWTLLPPVASLALTPLVVTRLGRLVRQNEELAAVEATLRTVGERLVTAESVADVARIITVGAEHVLGDKLIDGGLVVDPLNEADTLRSDLDPALAHLREHLEGVDRPTTAELLTLATAPGEPVVQVGLVVVQRQTRAVLILTMAAPLNTDERNAVTALCRESAIAIRAVDQTELQVRQRSEERFGALIDNSSDIVAVLVGTGRLTYVSPVVTRLLGHPVDDVSDINPLDLVHPEQRDRAIAMVDQIRFGRADSVELQLLHTRGHYVWFEVVGVDLSSDPNIGGIVLNLREISDRKQAEEQLLLSEARFKSLVQNSTDLVIVVKEDGLIRYASPSVRGVLGVDADELLDRHLDTVFRNSTLDWRAAMRGEPADGAAVPELIEFTFQLGEDDWRIIETSITDLRAEPAVHGLVLNARDVTERKQMEQRIRYQATHDDLTGLANRLLLLDDLGGMLSRNSGSTTVATILVGLDDFKDVNDSLGHGFGDQLLLQVSHRITSLLDFGDVAARVGGDQFAVAVERSHGEKQVTDLAEQVLATIAHQFEVDGREITLTASAGVVFDHDRSATPEVMTRNADIAMYRAKMLGKRQIVVFEPTMHEASHDRLELRADLQRAITTEQFVTHYQPIIELDTGRIIGAEALVRWQHPERGLLGPGLFVPLAEETGLIGQIGEWVLHRACADLKSWHHDLKVTEDDFYISVNLAVQQLTDDALVGTVRRTLEHNRLPASRLVLEITESSLMTDTERIRSTMEQLRALGARLAVDDFGTGYSSLGYIQQFEFDVLKIDKSFVDGLDTFTNQRIVTAVIELASQLDVRTIAEGIESQMQADLLRDLHCGYGQGYHFARPVPEREFRELLTSDRSTIRRPVG